MNRGDLLRVLRRQRDERGRAVHARGRERLQVGLDAGAAARVGRRDRQGARNGRGSSLRRHDPDQVRRVCSQPRGGHPGLPSLPWVEWRPGRRAGRSCSKARSSPTPAPSRRGRHASRRSRTSSTRASASGSAHDALYAHQADAWEAARRGEHVIVTTGTASGKTLAFNLPVLDALAREPKTRALYLYPTKALAQDQLRTLTELAVPGVKAGDLRRRHRGRAPLADPQVGEPDPHEPRHAPRRRAPAPRPLGRRAAEPALRRRRRGARLPRRVRLARRRTSSAGCAALPRCTAPSRSSCSPPRRSRTPASSRSALLGVEATVVGDDAAPRAERTVVLWNPALLDEELGVRASRARRGVAPARGARAARPAHDLLREEPQGGRADPPLRGRPARPRDRRAARAVPRRLHAAAAARDRAAPRRGRPARRQRDRRARARDRHRPARLRDLRRLPGDGRLAAPAVGPRGPPRARARGARRERGRARPVLHASPGDAPRPAGRGRDPRPREPARARRPRARGRVRGADRRRRPRDARRRGARARSGAPRAEAHAARLGLGRTRLPGRARPAPLDEPRLVHRRRRRDRLAARPRRARARVLDRARRRRLPPPGRALPRRGARPRGPRARWSSRSRATGTRRRRRRR